MYSKVRMEVKMNQSYRQITASITFRKQNSANRDDFSLWLNSTSVIAQADFYPFTLT